VDIFSTYAVDEDKEQNGTWMPLGDARFLVARAGNRAYAKLLNKEVDRNRKALDAKDASADALSDSIMVNTLAKTILLGWENVSFQGKKLEYSLENAKMALGHKEFRREIMRLADDFNAFKLVQEEEAVKN